MSELSLTIIKIVLTSSVTGLVFAQGLQVSPAQLFAVRRRPGLILRATLAGYVLVPLATLIIVSLVKPARNFEVGLALLAAGPVAPLMIVRIPRAGGQLAQVVALHLVMTLMALVTTPLVLAILGQALAFEARFDYARVSWLIARVVILPVCIGIAIHAYRPEFARTWAPRLSRGFGVALVVVVLLVLALGSTALVQTDARSYLAIGLSIIAALSIGHALGAGSEPEERMTLAMISAARHPGVVLMVVAASFPGARALPVLVPYLIVFMVISAIYIRRTSAAHARPPSPTQERDGSRPFLVTDLQMIGVKR